MLEVVEFFRFLFFYAFLWYAQNFFMQFSVDYIDVVGLKVEYVLSFHAH